MKRPVLAIVVAAASSMGSMVAPFGQSPHAAIAYAVSDSSSGNNSSGNDSGVLSNILGSGSNLASGGTGGGQSANTAVTQHTSAPPSATDIFAKRVVEDAYDAVASHWKQAGVKDAHTSLTVVQPGDFRTGGRKPTLLSVAASHGYDGKVFEWGNNIPYIEFTVNAPQAGLYNVQMDYYSVSSSLVPLERGILVNGHYQYFESRRIVLPNQWHDAARVLPVDQLGNEMPGDRIRAFGWQTQYLMDGTYLNDQPLRFYLKRGKNVIRLTNVNDAVLLGRIYLKSPQPLETYRAYLQSRGTAHTVGPALYTLEAEHPYLKSDPSIRALPSADPSVTPQRSGLITFNTFGDTSWQDGGQSVTWKVRVQTSGMYHIAFKYQQSEQINMPVFRTLKIDGAVPFQDMLRVPFPYTSTWRNNVLSDAHNTPYLFYLSKGDHQLTLVADPAPYAPVIFTVKQVMKNLDDLYLAIKMVTGNTQDQNRDWNFNAVFPGAVKQLKDNSRQLLQAYHELASMSGASPDGAQGLLISAQQLNTLVANPDQLPYRFKDLADGQGSINDSLGNVLVAIQPQPLLLDKFYVYGNHPIPMASSGFFRNLTAGVMSFLRSFTRDYSQVGQTNAGDLTVWVNRPREYVTLMQELADQDFTRRTGIKVSMMLMPDEQKLVLANASLQTPDVALGVNNATPFNMGIRGAVLDLSQFPDFTRVMSRFSPGAMLPLVFNKHDFALPETQDFWVLFYRKDILQALHIPIPQTWNDVTEILPQLQRYGMNFYDPIAGVGGYKPFYTTVPFIYQSGGSLFQSNGMGTSIDSEQALNGFKLMTNLFTVYGVPYQVPNFYSHFRQGDLPIGIANFNTYVQLTAAAPELNGLWGIAPLPGVRQSDGQIARWAPGTGEADMIFAQTQRKQQAWAFLKWWTSEQTQSKFGNQMETIYGPSYRWNSSNLQAFQQLPWPRADIQTIMAQWKWLQDVPHIPGDYMVERGISDAWNKVVFNGANPRMAIGDAVVEADREIRKQLEELGYISPFGQVLKKIQVPTMQGPNGKGQGLNAAN